MFYVWIWENICILSATHQIQVISKVISGWWRILRENGSPNFNKSQNSLDFDQLNSNYQSPYRNFHFPESTFLGKILQNILHQRTNWCLLKFRTSKYNENTETEIVVNARIITRIHRTPTRTEKNVSLSNYFFHFFACCFADETLLEWKKYELFVNMHKLLEASLYCWKSY